MKNLKPIQVEFNRQFPTYVDCFCLDSFRERIFIFSKNNFKIYYKDKVTKPPIVINMDIYFEDRIPKIVSLTYNPNKSQFWAAFSTGEIFAFTEDLEAYGMQQENKFILSHNSCIPEGILSMKWNPTMEKFVVFRADGQMKFFNQSCERIHEMDINSDEETEHKWIAIGWGKKETQFHGTAGKQAALAKEYKPENPFVDNFIPGITWAEKGTLLAVNVPTKDLKMRHIRIFNSSGELQCTSLNYYGLYRFITFNTVDRLFICAEKIDGINRVIFFEKNGLLHSKFQLHGKFNDASVKSIHWNAHLEILIIWLYEENQDTIQFYSTINHHWYLKHSLYFKTESTRLLDYAWDFKIKNQLHIITKSEEIKYTWANIVDHSLGTTMDDLGNVGVISGKTLYLTGFREKTISPPLAEHTLELSSPILFIAFPPESYCSNDLMILTESLELILASYTSDNNYELLHKSKFKLLDEQIIYHFIWVENNILFSTNDIHGYYQYKIDDKTFHIESHESFNFICVNHLNSQALYITDTQDYKLYKNDTFETLEFKAPEQCYDVHYCSKTMSLYNLDECNNFYINSEKIANNITSYYVHSHFLIVTTSAHRLIITKLKPNIIEIFKENFNSGRKIENHGKIIIAPAGSSEVILQFPRGNLEVINTKDMTYHLVNKYVKNNEFRRAMHLCRKFKLNMNSLIYKRKISHLNDNMTFFVKDIDNPRWLSFFITDLRKNLKNTEELSCIFNCLLLTMKEISVHYYMEPLLTLKVEENNIPGALELINYLIANPPTVSKHIDAKSALRFLINLVQTIDLFKEALGIYDLELAYFIAQHTNQDPQEYVPFLNNLKSMEENFRNYSINKFLSKPLKALEFLIKCPGMEEESLQLVKEHFLYKEALNIICRENKVYNMIARAYSEYLLQQGHSLEAAIIQIKINNSALAAEYFAKAGEWQQAIYHCDLSKMNRAIFIKNEILPVLLLQGRFSEASQLVSDIEERVALLCTHHLWSEALINAQTSRRHDLIETHITPGICIHRNNMLEYIKSMKKNLASHVERLKYLRDKKKTEKELEEAPAPPAHENIEDDVYSDVSTLSTATRTSRSSRSSKNKRKLSRKYLSLRASNPYEDIALVVHLHELYTTLYKLSDEFRVLGFVLLYCNQENDLFKLQTELEELYQQMHSAKFVIWDSEIFPLKPDTENAEHHDEPQLELKFQVLPEEPSHEWKFYKF